jgi:peptidoglycan/xylan/chitin deacetylase (PgdA/CDA1 family)
VRWRERLLDLAARVCPTTSGNGQGWWSAGTTILLYHRIAADNERTDDPFAVREEEFTRQMEWLASANPVVPLPELATRLRSQQSVAGIVAVTIDDGYQCTFARAWPILRRFGIPFTSFVDTARVDAAPDALSAKQIREMRLGGVEIGSHSHSHADLPTLPDAALREELTRPREQIEAWTGRPATALAYPYGNYDGRVRDFAAQAGYACACTCRQERSNLPGDDLLTLRRVEINLGDDLQRFQRKLGGHYAGVYARWYHLRGKKD